MKGKVLVSEMRESKKGNAYQKVLVQIGDTVTGYCMYFGDKILAPGDTVEFAVGTDYSNNLRLEVR